MKQLIVKAVYDKDRGMGLYDAVIYQDAVDFLADIADGDARRCLNAIELGITTTERDANTGKIEFTLDVAKESIQKRVIKYDKDGDNHYDTICAFIKSMRGSDPDAAVYYLARMLQGGEDIKYIARRIMIHASEDVGMADERSHGCRKSRYARSTDNSRKCGNLYCNGTKISKRYQSNTGGKYSRPENR